MTRRDTREPLVVLVDDLRDFRDGRPAMVLRSSVEALLELEQLTGTHIDELWLDHDLGGEDTIRPVVRYLEVRAFAGSPMSIGMVYVHSMNPPAADALVRGLLHHGYAARRSTVDMLVSGSV